MDWDTKPGANIIAILPPTRAQPEGEYRILYAVKSKDDTPTSADTKTSPYTFQAVTAGNLPQEVIDKYSVPSNSVWKEWIENLQFRPNIHVVVSTGSGTGLAQPVWESLVKPVFDYLGLNPIVHFTRDERTITDLSQAMFFTRANRNVNQAIVLLSGDGGVVDLVNALVSNVHVGRYMKPTITLLPLGTGNAMAHSAGIADDETMGLATMLRGTQKKEVPLFRAKFSPGTKMLVNEGREERDVESFDSDGDPIAHGAVVCSWGLHATLVADSDTAEYRKFGAERFKLAAKEALYPSDGSPPHAYKGKVTILRSGPVGPKPIERNEHAYVLMTFCSHLEAGFNINPESKPLDGKLHLVHFGPVRGEIAMEFMQKAYNGGQHVRDERVGYEEVSGIRIDFNEEDARWRRVCIDGKTARVEKGGWVEVRKVKTGVVDLVV